MFEVTKIKRVTFRGVAYSIRQLSPVFFMDNENILPINNIIESINKSNDITKKIEEKKDELKKIIKLVIEKGVIKARKFFTVTNIDVIINKIMDDYELYNFLFMNILMFSLGLKKKDLPLYI